MKVRLAYVFDIEVEDPDTVACEEDQPSYESYADEGRRRIDEAIGGPAEAVSQLRDAIRSCNAGDPSTAKWRIEKALEAIEATKDVDTWDFLVLPPNGEIVQDYPKP